MDIPLKTRQFYPDELRILKTLKKKMDKKARSGIRFYHFIVAAGLGAGATWLAAIIKTGFWMFIFGTLAVLAFGFIVFTPYELYKARKRKKVFLASLNAFIDKGTVEVYHINAKRIAVAKEYEDESDLFIIEYDTDKVLYLWDLNYNLRTRFPCLEFDIYEKKVFELFERLVYPLSERVRPLTIDKKAKWNYMTKVGSPEHLETEKVNFDELVKKISSYA